jgi:hypothetical protein
MSRIVQLISNDGRSFSVPEEICAASEHINNTLSISDQYETNPTLDLMLINGANLEVIVEFMTMHAANPIPTPLVKPVVFANLPKYATDFLNNLKMVSGNMKDLTNTEVSLLSLLYGASKLQITVLRELLMAKLVDSVRDKNINQLHILFGLPETHNINHAELRKIHEQYAYAFETD